MHGAAGDAGHGEVAVLHGDLGIVHHGDGTAHAQKVVVAKALQIGLHTLDGILAAARHDNAVKAFLGTGHIDPLGLAVGHFSPLQDGGDGVGHLAVGHHHGGVHLPADLVHPHQAARLHMIGVGDGEHHISFIGAGLDLAAHSVDGEGQELSLRGLEHRTGTQLQFADGDGVLHQPGGLVCHQFFAGLFQHFGVVHGHSLLMMIHLFYTLPCPV